MVLFSFYSKIATLSLWTANTHKQELKTPASQGSGVFFSQPVPSGWERFFIQWCSSSWVETTPQPIPPVIPCKGQPLLFFPLPGPPLMGYQNTRSRPGERDIASWEGEGRGMKIRLPWASRVGCRLCVRDWIGHDFDNITPLERKSV